MGLDCSHGAWHGAYSAFHRWRVQIAAAVGIPLDFMEGFYSDGEDSTGIHLTIRLVAYREAAEVREGAISQADSLRRYLKPFPLKWETLRPDPLHHLLHHSDCEGEITPKRCAAIAKRLDEVVDLLPDEDQGGHIGNIRDKTRTFAAGCRAAAAANEPLRFR